MVHVLVAAMKADGKVDSAEVTVIKSFFQQNLGYQGVSVEWVSDLIEKAQKESYPIELLCQEINMNFNRDAKLILLQMVYRVVAADDVITATEKQFIDTVVQMLQISSEEHEKIKTFFKDLLSQDEDDYYTLLGLTKPTTKEAVKKAYRDAIKENHPDKVHHLGAEFVKVAEEKMQQINQAYQVLMKSV